MFLIGIGAAAAIAIWHSSSGGAPVADPRGVAESPEMVHGARTDVDMVRTAVFGFGCALAGGRRRARSAAGSPHSSAWGRARTFALCHRIIGVMARFLLLHHRAECCWLSCTLLGSPLLHSSSGA